MSTSAVRAGERIAWGRFWWVSLVAVGGAIAANLITLALLGLLLDLPPDVPSFQPMAITIFTAIGVMAGGIAFAVVGGYSRNPRRAFVRVAFIALVISVIPNVVAIANPGALPIPGFTAQAAALLIVFHLVAATVAIGVLTRLGLETAAA